MAQHPFIRPATATTAWEPFSYKATLDADGHAFDAQARPRFQLLLQLQFDRQDSDYLLLRFLLEQEIIMHQESPFQGLMPSLRLALFLVARHKQLADIPLIWDALRANFDSWCGLDHAYLFVTGKSTTLHYLQSNEPQLLAEINKLIDLDAYPQAELASWWNSQEEWFPASESGESLLALVERHTALENFDLAHDYLMRWVKQQPDQKKARSTMIYHLIDFGNYAEAILHKQTELNEAVEPGSRLSTMHSVLHLYRLNNQFTEAAKLAAEMSLIMSQFTDWHGRGVGKICVERAFTASLAALETESDREAARELWTHGNQWLHKLNTLTLHILELGHTAAIQLELSKAAADYQQLITAEKARIRKMLGR